MIIDTIEQLLDVLSNNLNLHNDLVNISYINKVIPNQPEEEYYGNREYKLFLDIHNNNEKLHKRSTQLLFRLCEGDGKAIYLIGIDDAGVSVGCNLTKLFKSITSIIKMSRIVNSIITKITIYHSQNNKYICSIRCKKSY